MKKYKKIWIGGAVAISALILLPFLISVETYLRQAEKIATDKIGVPVTIADGNVAFLPTPRLVLSDIVVGKNAEVKIERLVVIPTLTSLFSETKTLDIKLKKPTIKKAALDFVSALAAKKSEPSDGVKVGVRHVKLTELKLIFPDMDLPIVNAEASIKEGSQLESASIETTDGKLTAELTPRDGEQLIEVNASNWTSPVGLPILVNKAKLEGHLKGNSLDFSKIDVALYNGKLTGSALLTWDKGWKANGKVKVEHLSVKEPSSLVSKSVYLSGDLFGNGNFSSTAKEAVGLADNLRADFKFNVNKGVLHGLDLVKVASLLLKQNQGGVTEFDEFSGLLNMSDKQYQLKNLKISSGLVAATGQVKVKANKQLDGVVEVQVKNSASLAAIPLEVSGTVSEPVVLPSKAALAGAVAGTAILGPGVGTSLGVKAGDAVGKLKGLFGGD